MSGEIHTGVKLIAMYLPQYHPIPENDAWWGAGFTEWDMVKAGVPRFPGHYQPHVPGRLGYYDLRDAGVRAAQAVLAKDYGIQGFCYYHYWFNGKRLLEFPFDEVLRTGKPDFPFCVCWANESWSRRWDSRDGELLVKQKHSDEDSLNFIQSLIPAFRDERYIRIDGKPLLILYRTALLPDPKKTGDIWRDAMGRAGIGDLYLVRIENFMDGPEPAPQEIGFDAALEFAPYWGLVGDRTRTIAGEDLPINVQAYRYDDCMKAMLNRPAPPYKLFRGVFTGWDNSARRKTNPKVILNSSPEKFAYWLSLVLKQTIHTFAGDERIVFINAWNEWGEGCHLEPDEKFGLKYLEAAGLALRQSEDYLRLIDKTPLLLDAENAALHGWFESLECIYSSENKLTDREELLLKAFENLLNHPKMTDIDSEINHQIELLLKEKDAIIASIYDSMSWKMTAPLRKLYGRFFLK